MRTTINFLKPLAVFVVLLGTLARAAAQYSGGTGEPNDPYQIATAADLILLGDSPEDYDKHFILTADIDLDPNLPGRRVFDKAVVAPETSRMEGWSERTPFTGIFDGNGHTISNLTCRSVRQMETHMGLFGWVNDPNAAIINLGLIDPHVYTDGIPCTGSLVGFLGRHAQELLCHRRQRYQP